MLRISSIGYLMLFLLALYALALGQDESSAHADATPTHVAPADSDHLPDLVIGLLGKPAQSDWKVSDSGVAVKLLDSAGLSDPERIRIPNGMRLYEVLVKNVPLGADSVVDTRDFQILIDSGTGQLFKIESTRPSYYEKVAQDLFSERPFEPDNCSFGSWQQVGLPPESPGIDFNQALCRVPGGLTRLDRIRARFLTMRHPQMGTKQMWFIETWGGHYCIPSGPPPGIKSPEYSPRDATYLRTLVDTESQLAISGCGRAIIKSDN